MLLIKKMFYLIVCAVVFSAPSMAEELVLPEPIMDLETGEILSSAHAVLPDGERWFVLVKEENGTNVLRCYGLSGEQYAVLFASEAGIPQGSNELAITIEHGMEDITTREIYEFPVLTISQTDEGNEYVELFIAYRYEQTDTWTFMRFWDYSAFGNVLIKDHVLQVYEDVETEQPILSEQIDIDLDLRTLDLPSLMVHINKMVESFQESVDDLDRHG